jgi:hypothetical protein
MNNSFLHILLQIFSTEGWIVVILIIYTIYVLRFVFLASYRNILNPLTVPLCLLTSAALTLFLTENVTDIVILVSEIFYRGLAAVGGYELVKNVIRYFAIRKLVKRKEI